MTTATALAATDALHNAFTPLLIAGMTWQTFLLYSVSVVFGLFIVWFFLLRSD